MIRSFSSGSFPAASKRRSTISDDIGMAKVDIKREVVIEVGDVLRLVKSEEFIAFSQFNPTRRVRSPTYTGSFGTWFEGSLTQVGS
jgi:hypothetical protein